LLLAGCLDAPTASRCNRVNTEIASVSGDTVTTTTGLLYFDEELGSGAVMQSCSYASIHARGGVQDGPIVYDTRETGGILRISPGRDNVMLKLAEGIIGDAGGRDRDPGHSLSPRVRSTGRSCGGNPGERHDGVDRRDDPRIGRLAPPGRHECSTPGAAAAVTLLFRAGVGSTFSTRISQRKDHAIKHTARSRGSHPLPFRVQ
jgi:hypothetical protein